MKELLMEVGKRVREMREALEISQDELATMSKVPLKLIVDLEAGVLTDLKVSELQRICKNVDLRVEFSLE